MTKIDKISMFLKGNFEFYNLCFSALGLALGSNVKMSLTILFIASTYL